MNIRTVRILQRILTIVEIHQCCPISDEDPKFFEIPSEIEQCPNSIVEVSTIRIFHHDL